MRRFAPSAWRVAPFVCGVLNPPLVYWLSPWAVGDWQFWAVVAGVMVVVAMVGATIEERWR